MKDGNLTEKSFPFQGARLRYWEGGEGEPILFLHGNGESHAIFSEQFDAFTGSCRILAPDSRGQGSSERGYVPPTISQMARDALALLDEAGVKQANVVGFSDGANVAMQMALDAPERVKRMVLVGGNLNPWGVKLCYQAPIVLGYGLCRFFALFSREAAKQAEILRLMVREPHIPPELLAGLGMPVLVMAGGKDLIREKHTRRIAALLPDSRLMIIPGASHFLFGKWGRETTGAIRAFLEER